MKFLMSFAELQENILLFHCRILGLLYGAVEDMVIIVQVKQPNFMDCR